MENLSSGIIVIGNETWYTRECFMQTFRIKKSTFYNQVKAGNIRSYKLFDNPNTLFYVYTLINDGMDD
jgi:hypothetical protein